MLSDSRFWIGVVVGVVLPVAYHKFVKPLPGGKTS
jgi:hypothetical protein